MRFTTARSGFPSACAGAAAAGCGDGAPAEVSGVGGAAARAVLGGTTSTEEHAGARAARTAVARLRAMRRVCIGAEGSVETAALRRALRCDETQNSGKK